MSISIDWGNFIWWAIAILTLLAAFAVIRFVLKVTSKILAFGCLGIVILVAALALLRSFGLF
ncbi:MAG: hypothetical protein JXB85_11290 [Anaerolineales bacterium]|nr:hypothetical protein [Anaerolineales bacterium]